MSTFWRSLAEIAKGQLFIGGHLSVAVVTDLAKRPDSPKRGKRARACGDHLPWPRLAIPH